MKVEEAEQIASKAIEQLSEALERGHSETLRKYLAAMAMFHRYYGYNLILIVSQRPDATRAAGTAQCRSPCSNNSLWLMDEGISEAKNEWKKFS